MEEFSHIILTTFNTRVRFADYIVPDADWLIHRFELFDEFCFPSVRSQGNQHFKWMVFFDANTPDTFRTKISTYARWKNFVPYYIDDILSVEWFAHFKNQAIMEHIDRSRYLITTTLDNDDAIAMDYVESVQKQFCRQDFEFINFTHGFLLNREKKKLFKKRDHSNPFISLIEKMENFKTVWCAGHTELHQFGNIRQADVNPMWLQVFHGRNVSNNIGLRRRVPLRMLDNNFNFNFKYDPDNESDTRIFLENAVNKVRIVSRDLLIPQE